MQILCFDVSSREDLNGRQSGEERMPHQTSCTLYYGKPETSFHLCFCCPFVIDVWTRVLAWEQFSLPSHVQPPLFASIADWWEAAAKAVSKEQRWNFNEVSIFIMWNLWKERNRRIFQNESSTSLTMALRTREDINQQRRACESQ